MKAYCCTCGAAYYKALSLRCKDIREGRFAIGHETLHSWY